MSEADRIVELELELMSQRDLLEQLNQALTQANGVIEQLEKRAERLEQQVENLSTLVDVPANERPPHY